MIDVSVCRGVMELRLVRPKKKNALTQFMYSILATQLQEAAQDPEVKVVLLTGSDGVFTSGNDLEDFRRIADGDAEGVAGKQFLQTLISFEKPLVAAVSGLAIGIGTTLLLHCDLVYASTSARFQLPFVDLGLVPEGGSSFILPMLLGHQRAAQLLMLGDSFGAESACQWGLVNGVCDDDELLAVAKGAALALAGKPEVALRKTKAMLKTYSRESLVQVVDQELEVFTQQLQSHAAREAIRRLMG